MRDELGLSGQLFYLPFFGMRAVTCILRNLGITVTMWESHARHQQKKDMTSFEFRLFFPLPKEYMTDMI